MIVQTQSNLIVDMAGCIAQRVNLPSPSIILISIRDRNNRAEDAGRRNSLMLYTGTSVADADAKFADFTAAAAASVIYYSFV